MKIKDLLASYSVTITPYNDVWLVSLNADKDHMVRMRTSVSCLMPWMGHVNGC